MEPPDHTNPHLPVLPTPPTKTYWWLIGPTPMEFENIGFSKPVNTGMLPLLHSHNHSLARRSHRTENVHDSVRKAPETARVRRVRPRPAGLVRGWDERVLARGRAGSVSRLTAHL